MPSKKSRLTTWDDVEREAREALAQARKLGRAIEKLPAPTKKQRKVMPHQAGLDHA